MILCRSFLIQDDILLAERIIRRLNKILRIFLKEFYKPFF